MTKNKYLLLISSIGALLLLMTSAVQENFLKEWRRIQAAGRSEAGPLEPQLRQIVNANLGVTDRCVTCHVSMGPGDESVTGSPVLMAHRSVVHDPAEYGCTVCHGGQGLATEKADAHGAVHFWPEPMIPMRYSSSGCWTCHVPLGIPALDVLQRARGTLERLDCLACHRLDGRGGTIRPDGGGMEGPDLSRVGYTGYDPEWPATHRAKGEQASSGPWKTSFAPLTADDRELIKIFLATRIGAPKLIEAKAAFHAGGCLGCHKVGGVGGDEGPDLSREGEKDPGQLKFSEVNGAETLENWFLEHFRSPSGVVAGSLMPSVAMPEDDLERLTMYMFSLRRRELPGSYLPGDRLRQARFGEREFSSDGRTLFAAFCSGCHGADGMGRRTQGSFSFPAIASPDFLELASDEFLLGTVQKGRPGRRMPAWGEKADGLRPEEIRRVTSFLRNLGGVQAQPESKPPRWVQADPAAGAPIFAAQCAGCHGSRGEGLEGPALNNKNLLDQATDSYLVETIGRGRRGTPMQGFSTPATVRATLTRTEIESVVAFIRSWEGGK